MLLFFILGLMSKPMLVTLPFVLLLMDYWPLRRFWFGISPLSYLKVRFNGIFEKNSNPHPKLLLSEFKLGLILLEKVPLFVLAIILSVITVLAQKSAGAVNSLNVLPLQARIDNALVSYLAYLGKMVWPSHLAVLYPHPIMLPWWQVGGALILLIAISLLAFRFIRQEPYFYVGWLWYLGVLLPVSGIVQSGVQAMADRFVYVPLIGIYIIIAWGFPGLLKRQRFKNIAIPIAATVVLSVFVATAWFQVQRWRDSITLFNHTLGITSGNYLIHNHIGAALRERGRVDEAISNFNEAIRINPKYAEAYNNLGAVLAEQGRTDEAIRCYEKSIKINPVFESAHYNLALVLTGKGQSDLVIKHYSEVLRFNPNNAEAHNNLGTILAGQGKIAEAALHFAEALRINTEYAQAHHNMALVLYRKGAKKQAEFHLQRSIQIRRQKLAPK
jgi:tetratricopeptide (TPR) repeat protein